MLMKDDKKRQGMVSIIMKKMKGSDMEQEHRSESSKNEYGEEVDYSQGYEMAVEEMMSAMESKDRSKFKKALKSFIDMCMDEYEMMEKED